MPTCCIIDRQLGVLDEIDRLAWLRAQGAGGSGGRADAAALSGFGGFDDEPEAFSEDRDWMAELVLVAKSTYVWLDQLSRDYGRDIRRLDQIPDEELDELRAARLHRPLAHRHLGAQRGLAADQAVARQSRCRGLGLLAWTTTASPTSSAATRPATTCASAPRQRGIRLAADMVPNHMGIDSRWVVEHPDRFISLALPALSRPTRSPAATLRRIARVGIQLEDHYWDRSDAAVVFKRVDKASGEDALHLPRQRRHQHALERHRAARLPQRRGARGGHPADPPRGAPFPVIRFDAAMVLARRHIQRLWYPAAGHAAAHPLARRARP